MSAADNMRSAVDYIDDFFGKGYAKEHPELVGAMVMAAAIDYSGTALHNAMNGITDALCAVSGDISEAISERND